MTLSSKSYIYLEGSVPATTDGDITDTKWVYAFEPLEPDTEFRYKARLFARVFAQNRVFDIGETYSPVAKYSSFRFLLALAVGKGFYLEQMDTKTAFLNDI